MTDIGILFLTYIFCCITASNSQIIDPTVLIPFMFTNQINGLFDVFIPDCQSMSSTGSIISQNYTITMSKISKQILPASLFPSTTMYAYGGMTKNGFKSTFPGPMLIAQKNVPLKITWINLLIGKHILPVDYSMPFMSTIQFVTQVPTVPHVHGVATSTASDGEPESYWTWLGTKSSSYVTTRPCSTNQEVFQYPNEQQAGNSWYHDHTIGITRLNVYAGLAGLYKIVDPNSPKQKKIIAQFGSTVTQSTTKFLVVTDKTFTKKGQLFSSNSSDGNPKYTSWVPEFFGNTILVNGVIWPKMTLIQGKKRFVLLNACQNRFLNIKFVNAGKSLPFTLIRVDNSYYDQTVVVTEFLACLASRIQFIIDFTNVLGDVLLTNDAAAPYPSGDSDNLVPQFTGKIMKFVIQVANTSKNAQVLQVINTKTPSIVPIPIPVYPAFPAGKKVFATLFEIMSKTADGMVLDGMMINGLSMENGKNCSTATYNIGQTYDFYIINLTPDTHPMHFHLVNFQVVKQIPFDVEKYKTKYFALNGGVPSTHTGFSKPEVQLDPELFRTGKDILPSPQDKVFKDVTAAHPGFVTVLRIKFAKNDGTNFNSINLKGERFVFHCHLLNHQDNEMMRYFCLQ